jgi:hypothetical protein
MGVIERRYGIAGKAAGEAALEHGAGRKATDAFVLSRIARAVVDALDADDRGAVDLDAATERVEALMIRAFGARPCGGTREQARRLARAAVGGQ